MTPDSLAAISEEVASCRACPRLVAWREQVAREKRAAYADWDYWGRPVPGFGDPNASVVVVGLAPAAHGANRTGRMFTGDRSGEFLYASLHRTGFATQATSRHRGDGQRLIDCWITAAVRCAPPQNRPTPAERDRCQPFLQRELALLPARVLVALGAFAWEVLVRMLGPVRPKPVFGHGAITRVRASASEPAGGDSRVRASASEPAGGDSHVGGYVIVGSYHPSQQNTFTGRLTPAMLDDVFTRARQLAFAFDSAGAREH